MRKHLQKLSQNRFTSIRPIQKCKYGRLESTADEKVIKTTPWRNIFL